MISPFNKQHSSISTIRPELRVIYRSATQFLSLLIAAILGTGCTVWKTARSVDDNAEEVTSRNGQPYFLPKALIRLQIKADQPANSDNKPKQAPQVLAAMAPAIGAPEGMAPSAQLYTISIEKKIVADRSRGPYYAQYSNNWMFDDKVGIKVGSDQLLETIVATVDDRTADIADNLVNTAENILKFQAAGGLGAASIPSFLGSQKLKTRGNNSSTKQPPYIKQLNIDITFDPFDKDDLERVQALFKDSKNGTRAVFSPLIIDIQHKNLSTASGGKVLEPLAPEYSLNQPNSKIRKNGLYFPEPTTVEVVVKNNPALSEYLRELLDNSHEQWLESKNDARESLREKVKKEKKSTELADELATKKNAVDKAQAAVQALIEKQKVNAQPPATNEQLAEARRILMEAEDVRDRAAESAKIAQADATTTREKHEDLNEIQTSEGSYVAQIQSMLYGSLPGEKARDSRMVVAVPNKKRVYSVVVPRSAFITRTTELTIQNGELLGIKHTKPSEVEGFTEIPESITSKIAAIPRALLTTKQGIFGGQKDVLTALKEREDASISLAKVKSTRDVVIETQNLNSQDAYIKQKITLAESQSDLNEILKKDLPQIESETDKLIAAKALEDARKALYQSETERLNEEKNRLVAERSLAEEKRKGSGSNSPTGTGVPANTTDPSKLPGAP